MALKITAYGDGGFRLDGERHIGPLVVHDETVVPWQVTEFDALSAKALEPLLDLAPRPEILLIGCGASIRFFPKELRQILEDAGIGVDAMDTGAACRTYNVLVQELRNVAAALFPVE